MRALARFSSPGESETRRREPFVSPSLDRAARRGDNRREIARTALGSIPGARTPSAPRDDRPRFPSVTAAFIAALRRPCPYSGEKLRSSKPRVAQPRKLGRRRRPGCRSALPRHASRPAGCASRPGAAIGGAAITHQKMLPSPTKYSGSAGEASQEIGEIGAVRWDIGSCRTHRRAS